MDRRRSLLKIAALRSERERQVGVNCTKGYLESTDAGPLFDGPRTLECFFKYISSDKMQVIAGFGIFMIEIQILTKNQLRVYCGGVNAIVDIVPGDSYLVDVAYDGTTAICYLNGAEAARFPVTGYKVMDSFRTGSNTYIPQGSLVFCRHYNYALSAEEVAAHYNGGDPAGYVVPLADKYRWEASESNIGNIRFYPNNEGSGVTSYLEDNANGFTGRYAHIIWGSSGLLSVYSYQFMGHPVGCVVEAKFKYRSNAPVRVLADNSSLPINMEDAADATIVYRTTGTNISGFSVTVPNADANSWVEIQPVSLRTLGCIAEYLPQNLVGQWHEKPFEITGITTYTWTGETDPVYYQELLLGRFIQTGAVVMIKGSVSDYQSGEPFVYVGNRQAMIPAQNGSFTLKVINNRDNIDRIYYYGGTVRSDRRLTITIDSVELIPDVALSWLDSAKQLPLNDEYLPPLFESIVIGDATPIHIMGENSYTWTGVDDPVYSYTVRCSRYFKIGGIYKVRVTISNWEAGGPPYFKIATDNTIIMSGFTGNGTYAFYITAEGIPYDYMFVYAGHGDTDRRMTITVDSIEPIAEHGYDLTASGMPQIIIK